MIPVPTGVQVWLATGQGIKFQNGIEVIEMPAHHAA
jgi:hypothetical protein